MHRLSRHSPAITAISCLMAMLWLPAAQGQTPVCAPDAVTWMGRLLAMPGATLIKSKIVNLIPTRRDQISNLKSQILNLKFQISNFKSQRSNYRCGAAPVLAIDLTAHWMPHSLGLWNVTTEPLLNMLHPGHQGWVLKVRCYIIPTSIKKCGHRRILSFALPRIRAILRVFTARPPPVTL